MTSNRDVACAWATWNSPNISERRKKSMRGHRASGSMSYAGAGVFSRRMLIGKAYDGYSLVTSKKVSISTNQHVRLVSSYAHDIAPVFEVPVLDITGPMTWEEMHNANLAHLCEVFDKVMEDRVKYWRRHIYVDEVGEPVFADNSMGNRAHSDIVNYANFTNTKFEAPDLKARMEVTKALALGKYRKYFDPKAVAQRERTKARTIAKELLLGAQ